MGIKGKTRVAGGFAILLASTAAFDQANATEGYFALAYGPVQRGQAGAGVAFSQDAMSATINPASAAGVGKELSFGLEIFAPFRGVEATGPGVVPAGETRSGKNFFPVPNFAYNRPLGDGVLNIAAYGNGGMNTSYPAVANPACGGGTGVFCAGPAGVDLSQLFISLGYARKSGPLSWGIAPTLAVQRFSAEGLAAFTPMSVDGANLTNNGAEFSTGFGLRAGIQYEVSPTLTVGLSGQSKFDMSPFDKYAGLFENGGDFDIPASLTAGIAYEARDDLTVMADVQKIFYSGVPAVSNPMTAGPLGAPGGAGFGWDDVNVLRLGAEWRQSDDMTWRVGYAHATNPVGADDVTFNVLAPGIVEDHLTIGGSRRINDTDQFDFSIGYILSNSVSGPEIAGNPPGLTGSTLTLEMHQFSVSAGWTRKF